jgi:predicted nucleic acid-binding protein
LSDTSLRGQLAFDSSVLIAMVDGSDLGVKLTNALVAGEITVHTSLVNIAEAEYVLCRRVGEDIAKSSINDLLASRYVIVEDDPSIHRAASGIKCDRSISLVDCYTFAVAEATSSRAVFLFKESDLLKEIERKPFGTDPIFLT